MTDEFEEALDAIGRDGAVFVSDLADGRAIAWHADDVVQCGSAFKIAVCLGVYCQASIDEVDLAEYLTFTAERAEATNPNVEDSVALMMRLSDNLATTALINRVGHDRILARLDRLDLPHTTIGAADVAGDIARITAGLDDLARRHGFDDWADIDKQVHVRGYDAIRGRLARIRVDARSLPHEHLGPTTTARELSRLYAMIWQDTAGPESACASVRAAAAHQQLKRLSHGFAADSGITIAGKGGRIPGIVLVDAGVISYPDGQQYVATVTTRARTAYAGEEQAYALIGELAAAAVVRLRHSGN